MAAEVNVAMTSVTILPIPTAHGGVRYCAVSNGKRSQGATAGEALDALTAQMTEADKGTLVIMQDRRPDQFFNAEQKQRLAELMAQWRTCRDEGKLLPANEEVELDSLVDAELRGAGARAAAMLGGLKQ
jgi:hypothetical protein